MRAVLEAARGALAAAGVEASLKRLDSFTGQEGVCLRTLPSTSRRAYDGSREVSCKLQAVVRSRSQLAAMERCRAVADALEDEPLPLPAGLLWTATRVYTEPQELMLEEAGFYAYDVRFEIEVNQEKGSFDG